MRLRRLELQGFKSFLDRTILSFEPGVTGVVGPNGCGKSNIVDAIMWVMGEQSPKHLRGESMTDIIFNGSDTRAPTSMAEVSLIMDREGVPLAPQFSSFDKGDEVSVTRRLFRDGTSEFYINKTSCRLKDIHELFMDTGVGRRAYSIIEQGQIDRMINVKPEDRRYLFEEVAGITKYKAKRKEAEKKLELTNQNLLRIQDIIAELEKQIRSLKIQATRARKYKEIKVELEAADLHLIGRNLSEHTTALAKLQAERDELINQRSESDAGFSHVEARITELEILRIDQEKAYQSWGDKEREISNRIQKLESSLSVLVERRKFIEQSSEALATDEAELTATEEKVTAEKGEAESEKEALEASLGTLDARVAEKENDLVVIQQKKHDLAENDRKLERRQAEAAESEISRQKQIQYSRERQEENRALRGELNRRLTEAIALVEEYNGRVGGMDGKITACSERQATMESEASTLHSECQTISSELTELEARLFQARETFHAKRSRLESLTELQNNLEGYSPTAREVLLRLRNEEAGAGVEAYPLAEVIQPDAAWEDHLELLLGNDLNTLIVRTKQDAESLARTIETKALERVRIASLEELSSEVPIGVAAPGLESALNRVRVTEGFSAAAKKWLGNVYLCESPEAVLGMRASYPSQTLLCPQTSVIAHADTTLTSGTTQTRMGVFARRREIEELSEICRTLEVDLAAINQNREALLMRLTEQEKRHDELKDSLSHVHIESVELRKERERLQGEQARAEKDQTALMDESEKNMTAIEALTAQIELWEIELDRLSKEKQELVTARESLKGELEAASQSFDQAMEAIHEIKMERTRIAERLSGLKHAIDRMAEDLAGLSRRRESIRAQRVRENEERQRLEEEAEDVGTEQSRLVSEREAALASLAETKAAFNETCSLVNECRDQKDGIQKRLNELLEDLQKTEIKTAQEQAQLEQLRSISLERYHREPESLETGAKLTAEQLPLLASQLDVTWDLLLPEEQLPLLQEHVKNLREKIERYGEVNLTAIQEFDEVQKRFDFLSGQKTDLEKSMQILQEAIIKIDESTKTRFEDTFDAVNKKFREIFPILFNGGKAELSLTNPDNLLESGVDVMVQPPGKRLQSISLLSGGEKALTAVSLILAIFARKPSPFCLLDEVDAPLDDANVSRFNTVIRKMAEKTQFIVITHNKKTMEIAEALYGVTMERAGISKMTSVRLN